MGAPAISFLMPLKYYQEDFLRQSLDSVRKQDDPRWRLLIVVEGDDRERFEGSLADVLTDERIELVTMAGAPFTGSINTGMRSATTEYVALVFADDALATNAVRVLSDAIRAHPEVDFFYTGWQSIDARGRHLGGVVPPREPFTIADFKRGSPVKHLMCWRRRMGLSVGGVDETLVKAPDDYDFPWTMAESRAVFRAIPECLYFIREHCEYERRTTHIPLNAVRRGIHAILRKHGVGFFERHWIVAKMRRGSLGYQAIYRNSFDRWLKTTLGLDARRAWRQPKCT